MPGEYEVKFVVENKYGCTDTVIQKVKLKYFDALFVPNALTPNSGPYEDRIFLPKGSALAEYRLQIFNTWGELLWETDKLVDGHPAEGWDGTSKGEPLPQGVYVWKITATFQNGELWGGKDHNGSPKRLGSVTLIR